jgi:hypothetical protein
MLTSKGERDAFALSQFKGLDRGKDFPYPVTGGQFHDHEQDHEQGTNDHSAAGPNRVAIEGR